VAERSGGFLRRTTIDVCPSCRGVWFDRGEIGRISRDRGLEILIVRYAGGRSALTCPRCAQPMSRRPVSEITLEVCLRCRGVWMDAGELEAAARTLGNLTVADSMSEEERRRSTSPGPFSPSWRWQRAPLVYATLRAPGLRTRLEAGERRSFQGAADRVEKL